MEDVQLTLENGQVVDQDAQTDSAVLTVIGSGSQDRSHVSLEHAEYRFDLPALALGFPGASLLHQFTIAPPHWVGVAVGLRPGAIDGGNDTMKQCKSPGMG